MSTALILAPAVARTLVGVLLLLTGIVKARSGRGRFRDAILGYDLVPAAWAALLASWLPKAEIALGALLISGVLLPWTDTAAFALITVYEAALVASLVRGRANHCGCAGFTAEQVQTVQWQLVYRNLALLAILALDGSSPGATGPVDWLAPGLAASPSSAAGHPFLLWSLLGVAICIAVGHGVALFRRATDRSPAASDRPSLTRAST